MQYWCLESIETLNGYVTGCHFVSFKIVGEVFFSSGKLGSVRYEYSGSYLQELKKKSLRNTNTSLQPARCAQRDIKSNVNSLAAWNLVTCATGNLCACKDISPCNEAVEDTALRSFDRRDGEEQATTSSTWLHCLLHRRYNPRSSFERCGDWTLHNPEISRTVIQWETQLPWVHEEISKENRKKNGHCE